MTRLTRSSAVMSFSGSPSSAMRSARLPGSIVPTSLSMRQASAPQRVPASSASAGDTPKRTSVCSSKGINPCMLSVPHAKRTPEARWRGKFSATTRRAERTLSMIAGRWPSPCSMPLGCMKIEGADEPDTALDQQRDVLVGGQGPVLDGSHALAYGELQPRTAMRVSRRIGADAIGFLHRGANLFARVRAAGRHGPGRADAAGHEDLDVI